MEVRVQIYVHSKLLAKNGYKVIGIDNINDYYDQNLKLARLQDMGIDTSNNERKYCHWKEISPL